MGMARHTAGISNNHIVSLHLQLQASCRASADFPTVAVLQMWGGWSRGRGLLDSYLRSPLWPLLLLQRRVPLELGDTRVLLGLRGINSGYAYADYMSEGVVLLM